MVPMRVPSSMISQSWREGVMMMSIWLEVLSSNAIRRCSSSLRSESESIAE